MMILYEACKRGGGVLLKQNHKLNAIQHMYDIRITLLDDAIAYLTYEPKIYRISLENLDQF